MWKLSFILVVAVACLASFLPDRAPFAHGIDKRELGKLLFFDPILSATRTISCAGCHRPEYAFADTAALSLGALGRRGNRNTPSAMNLSLQEIFFWDGRSPSLEDQALRPIENPVEMNLPLNKALLRLKHSGKYRSYFKAVFNSEPTLDHLGEAIAAYERSLETSNSPFDNWKLSGDTNLVSASVKRGFTLFSTKGKCTKCHFGSDFTQHEFRNIGLFNGNDLNDSGRASITRNTKDLGAFKVPGLRNVAVTSPYMHNGMFRTLKEVIDFYNEPGKIVPDAINRDTALARPLGLTEKEKADLEAFLISLTDNQFVNIRPTR